jgi:hypothetical protein
MKECSADMLLLLCSLTRSSRVEVVIRPQMVVFLGHTVAELARAPGVVREATARQLLSCDTKRAFSCWTVESLRRQRLRSYISCVQPASRWRRFSPLLCPSLLPGYPRSPLRPYGSPPIGDNHQFHMRTSETACHAIDRRLHGDMDFFMCIHMQNAPLMVLIDLAFLSECLQLDLLVHRADVPESHIPHRVVDNLVPGHKQELLMLHRVQDDIIRV